ncbi:MAG TPA: MBL fold metallo-hydrolase [bacterium]|nr:MBL fold metallo-hydrolase [bacterium]
MKITYLGHATFLLESGPTAILIDPFNEKVGYSVPQVAPSVVLVSHEPGDHNHLAMAQGHPKVIRGLADGKWRTVRETVDGVAISSVPTFHDASQGKERGRNTVFVLDAEGLRVVHLGDLGHPLDAPIAKAIGRPDVLMVPVGGHCTIDAAQAREVVAQLRPAIAIPIHYKTEVNPGMPITGIEGFLAGIQASRQAGHTVTVERGTVPDAA